MIELEPDVSVEVLDWGGSGRPVVLVAGGGNTAHVFDDFAPPLTARYRVYGITRRGKLPPSAPSTADRESIQALQRFMTRTLGATIPQSGIHNEFEFAPAGQVGRFHVPQRVSQAIAAGMRKPDYTRLRVPALAMYAQLTSIRELPAYNEDDESIKASLEEYRALKTPIGRSTPSSRICAKPRIAVFRLCGARGWPRTGARSGAQAI